MADVLEYNDIFYTNFTPKVQNQFIMEVDGIPSYMIKAAQRPNYQFGEVIIDHINLKRKLKGKIEWQNITISLYDPIVPSGAQTVQEWARLQHEEVTGRDGYPDFYKKDIDFYAIGPVGDKVEQWKLKGAWIQSANFGDFDWANQDPMMIELTLAYDYAILEF